MKKQVLSILAVVVLFLTAFASPVAQAAKPPTSPLNHGPVKNQYSGDSALMSLYSTVDGCIYTYVSVMASAQTVKSKSGGSSTGQYATLYIDRYDNCNGSYLGGGYGYAPIDSNSYQIDKQLNSAHLQTVIPVYDWYSGTESTIAVDLNWTGSGDLQKGKFRYQFQSKGCKTTYSSSGTSRNATVSGSVSDGVTDFMNGATTYASLQSAKSGEMIIGCGI